MAPSRVGRGVFALLLSLLLLGMQQESLLHALSHIKPAQEQQEHSSPQTSVACVECALLVAGSAAIPSCSLEFSPSPALTLPPAGARRAGSCATSLSSQSRSALPFLTRLGAPPSRSARSFTLTKGRTLVSRLIGLAGAFALAGLLPCHALAATDADLAEIRAQIKQLRESYEARIQALEERLKEAEAKGASGRCGRGRSAGGRYGAVPGSRCADFDRQFTGQCLQPRDHRRAARRVREPLAGSDEVRDRRLRSERRHRSRQARIQHRRIGARVLRQRRRQDLRQPRLLARARQLDRGRGSLRHVHVIAVRLRAEVRTLPLEHRLPERQAPARLEFLRRAAALPGVSRRAVQERRPAGEMGRADRFLPRVWRRGRRRLELSRHGPQQERHRQRRASTRMPAANSVRATNGARGFRTCSFVPMVVSTCRRMSRATWCCKVFPAGAS